MGKLNPFAKPKTPAPVVVEPPLDPNVDAQAKSDLEAERRRRAGATGSTGNIQSSLVGAISDMQSSTKKSSLLGG
jgi:hypothetical protein